MTLVLKQSGRIFIVFLACLFLAANSLADLSGQTVSATMSSPGGGFLGFTQFSSPVVVGPGTEFSTIATDVFNQIWTIGIDLSNSSFTVGFTEQTRGDQGAISGPNLLKLDLTFAQPILSSVSFAGFTSTNDVPVGGSGFHSLSNTASSIDLSFWGMGTGDIYTFDVATIPEPSSFLLATSGLLFLANAVKRKRC